MSIGLFVDKEHPPTLDEVWGAIGAKRSLWESLVQLVVDNYRVQEDFKFYGKKYGWALRFRKRSKALLSIYPGKKTFVVQIVVGPTQIEKTSDLGLGENVRKVFEDAHQFPEGRWLFIKIKSKRDVNDIQQLLLLKSRPTK